MDNQKDIEEFLLGRDPLEKIVSIECGYDDEKVSIIFKNANDEKRIRMEDFKPFVWAKRNICQQMFQGDKKKLSAAMKLYGIKVKELITKMEDTDASERIENGYRYMFYATRRMSFQVFLTFFQKAGTPVYPRRKKNDDSSKKDSGFLAVSPVEQYMMYTKRRLFKGYDGYDELKRMLFDLETQGLNPRVHAIDQIGIRTNKGFERVISITGEGEEKRKNELAGIEEMIRIIATEQPDVIAGHNSEKFDWNFIIVRCEMLGTSLEDLTLKYFNHPIYKKNKEAVLKLGGEVEYYFPTVFWGFNIIDSLHAVRRAQAIDSSMKSANLKYVTKYLELNKENRVYVPGNHIGEIWMDLEYDYAFNNTNGDWYDVRGKEIKEGYELVTGRYIVERYLLDDIWETDQVELALNEANFLVSKMLPTTFQRACTMGTAGIWKLIMLAWCYENNLAIPALGKSQRFTGGLSRLLKTGYVDRVVKLDYNSLYPSIMLTWNVKNPLDISNAMLSMLNYVLTNREYYKGLKADFGAKAKAIKKQLKTFEGSAEEKHALMEQMQEFNGEKNKNDKKQLPLKILGNSVFGAFGGPQVFPFGNIQSAEKVTCIGRQSLRLMISHFTNLGYIPIVGDSVTYDTPILIKNENGTIDILPICDIFDETKKEEFEKEQYRDFSHKNYQVLTRSGWKEINYVYKHKTEKPLRRIETKDGLIDCTEDHSLFNQEGEEIKPINIHRGDKIEIFTNKIEYQVKTSITKEKAWLFGFFMADGSSVYGNRTQKYFSKKKEIYVIHKGKRANWKISNQSLERLGKAKEILENVFEQKCSIKNHMKSSNVYDLVVENVEFAKYFSSNFYTSYRYKKVPNCVLNAPMDVKKAFLDGFCCGDGQGDTMEECISFGQKSKIAIAGLYFILKELGYNFRCHNRHDKEEFISFVFRNHRGNLLREEYSHRKEDEVWNNSLIHSKNEFVYDISADGTFVNALGMIVCHNTDGFNFQMPTDDKFRYTDEHPYISNGKGRNSVEGQAYTKVEADVCEFEDLFFYQPWNGGINKMGLGIDEYVPASINFSRKNYSDLLDNGKTKLVGNTIKSRKMSGYIENFLTPSIDMLLHGKGQEFLENYYDYISKIYNYQIPLRDIASKGKIKKTISDYIADCKTTTKSGSKKSRQVWYELVIEKQKTEDFKVELDDTIYYINTGTKKSESDVKRVTHQFVKYNGEVVELNSRIKKEILLPQCEAKGLEYRSLKTKEIKEMLKPHIIREEDEIIINCKLVPSSIIEADEDILCNDEIEYNVVKYIEQFNNRIKPLLVCFDPSIRPQILINNPDERPYFTPEQCKLVSGYPNRETDQDTYEALMTPERKEIEYWLSINETPPFIKECGIEWDKLVAEYLEIKKQEDDVTFKEENAKYLKALSELTQEERDRFTEEYEIPRALCEIVELKDDLHFYFKKLPTMTPSTGGSIFDDILDDTYSFLDKGEEAFENAVANLNE